MKQKILEFLSKKLSANKEEYKMKWIIIGCYIAHKIHWKRTHKEKTIKWDNFFEVVK